MGDFFLGFCLPPWIYIDYDASVLSVSLPDLFTCNACCCWRMGNWEVLGGGRMEEKVIVICSRWGQGGKGYSSRFLSTELGMRIDDSIPGAVEVLVWFQPTSQGSEGSTGGVGRSKESLKLIFCCCTRDKTWKLCLKD